MSLTIALRGEGPTWLLAPPPHTFREHPPAGWVVSARFAGSWQEKHS
jgi:hypothetical protein